MYNKLILIGFSTFFLALLNPYPCFSQDKGQLQDSLLIEKIKNIEVSLNSIDVNDENLFMNSVSFEDFYDELSPDGEWIQITKEEIEKDLKDGEGQSVSSMLDPDAEFYFIWHPTSVEEGWRPYSNGRWVWTTDGWMWASNHTWGWAVFHYGRWWNSPRYGWVWMPGYVWAPAWVQWRISENHIGWCPLTPDARWNSEFGISSGNYSYRNRNADWVFIEKNKFADDIGSSNIITSSENKGLVERSNSILDLRSENDRIFNNGPDVKDVESRTGKMMKQKMIKYTNSRGKALLSDDDVSIYKPNLKKIDLSVNKSSGSNEPKKFKMSKKVRKINQLRKIKSRIIIRQK